MKKNKKEKKNEIDDIWGKERERERGRIVEYFGRPRPAFLAYYGLRENRQAF